MINDQFLGLHNLNPVNVKQKKKKRRGRGESSGLGKTSGRGHKGQKARKSGKTKFGFEGGQTPLIRKVPKKKLKPKTNPKRVTINIDKLLNKVSLNSSITIESLRKLKLLNKSAYSRVKIIRGKKDLKAYQFCVHNMSKSLQTYMKNKGGSVVLIKL